MQRIYVVMIQMYSNALPMIECFDKVYAFEPRRLVAASFSFNSFSMSACIDSGFVNELYLRQVSIHPFVIIVPEERKGE